MSVILTALTFSDVGVLITNVQFIVDITSMVREYLVVEFGKYFSIFVTFCKISCCLKF